MDEAKEAEAVRVLTLSGDFSADRLAVLCELAERTDDIVFSGVKLLNTLTDDGGVEVLVPVFVLETNADKVARGDRDPDAEPLSVIDFLGLKLALTLTALGVFDIFEVPVDDDVVDEEAVVDALRELDRVIAPVFCDVAVVEEVKLFIADGDTFEVTLSVIVPALTVGLTVVVREDVDVFIADLDAIDE